MMKSDKYPVRTLPWGEKIYLEIPLHKKSGHKFYVRHGQDVEGKDYVEISSFGPRDGYNPLHPFAEGENYMDKIRIYSPVRAYKLIAALKECADSADWDLGE